VRFHTSIGFAVTGAIKDYHGPGQDRIMLRKEV
jgi:hypothetical protein